MRVSTQKSATDPRTGQIDMDALSTGTTVCAHSSSAADLALTLCPCLAAGVKQGPRERRVEKRSILSADANARQRAVERCA